MEVITIFLGGIYSLLYAALCDISFNSDWMEQLIGVQIHTPVATWSRPTIVVLSCVGIAGYLILRLVPLKRMPPLVVVSGIACSYGGILVSILWSIQVCTGEYIWLMVFPLNCVLLVLTQIKQLILQWNQLQEEERRGFESVWLQKCNNRLLNAQTWPIAAFLLFLPIMGILVAVLVLFGQSPDALIRAFTETSDWNLSQKVSPPNLPRDGHYLCTVAAGGHQKVVKPLRLGVRHGHLVTVNRQLCIANAFEQILEERVPNIHRAIRKFYDTYGLPIAKMIHSPYAADIVYFLMKPLEWLFLIVIYFCDVKPENRIAVQYLPGKCLRTF